MKSVSIVVPVFNMESYLRQCLDSLYVQIDNTMEVILINDGSTDASPEICKEYVEQYPETIFINKENGGLADARNAGMNIAIGEYTYFIDSDDWLAPNSIRTLYKFAIEQHCEVVQGGFYYAFEDHLEFDNRWKVDENTYPFTLTKQEAMKELVKQNNIKNFAWGKLYKTDIIRQIPFKVGAKFEDSFWMHYVIDKIKCYGIVPQSLYYYRQRPSGISGAFSLNHLDLMHGNEERLLFLQKKYPELVFPMAASFWRQSLGFHEMARHTHNKDVREAFEVFWKHVNCDYHHLFDEALRHNVTYQLVKRMPSSAHFCLFVRRVYDHFFAPRLKVIPIN